MFNIAVGAVELLVVVEVIVLLVVTFLCCGICGCGRVKLLSDVIYILIQNFTIYTVTDNITLYFLHLFIVIITIIVVFTVVSIVAFSATFILLSAFL